MEYDRKGVENCIFEELITVFMVKVCKETTLCFVTLGILLCFLSCSIIKNRDEKNVILLSSNNIMDVLTVPNTTYIISKDIDLQGQHITMPSSCTLSFNKGAIKNGSIHFDNTRLKGRVSIHCKASGYVNNDTVYVDWFQKGGSTKSKIDNSSDIIQSVFNLNPRCVVFGGGYYSFNNIQINKRVEIIGNGTVIVPSELEQNDYAFHFPKNVFYAENAGTIIINDFRFEGKAGTTILSGFKSTILYGEPLIWVDKAEKVVVDHCVFKDVESCTYCNKAYTYYGKKQGSCVCLWDVSDASYVNCEQVNCRHDEQVWIIAVQKPIMNTKVTYKGNYIHDMKPGPNSSAFTCVAGTCIMENNRVDNYNYPGSMFNVFAKKAYIKKNDIKNSYCSSVFDVCEYSYFHNDDVVVENNNVDAVNSVLVLGQSAKVTIKNNRFRGLGLYYSANNRRPDKETGGYQYWYSDADSVLPTDAETLIDGNMCDLTAYDGNRSIAGATADYSTGEIKGTQTYNNVGVNYGCGILLHPNEAKAGSITITNNTFTSISSLEGVVDKNNLANLYPYTIKLVNTQNATIKGNIFNGGYPLYASPNECTSIGIYNYPDVMEKMKNPGNISRNPSEYGKYVIEDNVYNMREGKVFYPLAVYARTNTYRQTELKFKELVVRNNILTGPEIKTVLEKVWSDNIYKQSGPVKVMKQVLK